MRMSRCHQPRSTAQQIALQHAYRKLRAQTFRGPNASASAHVRVAQQQGQLQEKLGPFNKLEEPHREQEPLQLSPELQLARDECLLQARIGYGERGRGLFFSPLPDSPTRSSSSSSSSSPFVSTASTPATITPTATSSSAPCAAPPPVLLRVPLPRGLPLVAPGGPGELQRGLLQEWQSYHGVRLPERLAGLLADTDRPPALRLAAWLLWVARSAGGSADGCADDGGSSNGSGGGALPLASYLRTMLPAPTGPAAAPASCLRLAGPGGAAELPEDARQALQGMREQVLSYIEELRRLGLAEGCTEAELWWAFDMVISRAFAVTATSLPSSTPSSFSSTTNPTSVPLALYLPWACLLNHSSAPNATFAATLAADPHPASSGHRATPPTPSMPQTPAPATASAPASPAQASLPTSLPDSNRALRYCSSEFLVAPRRRFATPPIDPGSEICISYGEGLDNVQLLLKYGFCTAGNPNDRLPLPPGVAAAAARLQRRTLCSAAEQVADRLTMAPQHPAASGSSDNVLSRIEQEQHRARVYAALATLLEAAAVQPGQRTPSEASYIATVGSTAELRAWAKSEGMRCACLASHEARNSFAWFIEDLVPYGVQLPAGACQKAGIDALWHERRLLADCVGDILGASAFSSAAGTDS